MAILDQIELPNGITYDIQDNQPAVLDIPNTPAQIATFSGAADLPMASLKVAVTPYQDLSHGDPSPSNICPIIGWDKAVVTVVSEQLFNEEYPNIGSTIRKITLDVGEGSFTMLSDIPVFINGGVAVANIFLQTGTGESTASSDVDGVWKNHPVTVNSTDGKVTIKYRIFIGNTAYDPRNFNVILCKTATTYTIDLNGTRYGGELDVLNGVDIDTLGNVDLGTLTWIKENNHFYSNFLSDANPPSSNSQPANMLCEAYKNIAYSEVITETNDASICLSNSKRIYIYDSTKTSLDGSAFKTAMNGVQLVYELATPITVQLSPTPVKSLEGTNNIFANCGQITEGKYVVSKYDGITAKISEVAHFAKTANKQVPEIHRKYESTSYYATTASQADSTWYFMSVKPDNWYKPWKVKFKVHTYCPNYPSYESITWSTFTGREQSLSYANFNERYDSAHYYISAATLKKAGFDAGYGHALGVSILYGGGYTTAAYYRTFEVDYYECENCTVTILDSPTKLASWNGYSSTNYNSVSNYDAINRGLRETSDDNDGHYYSRRIYSNIKAGSNKIFPYTLIMQNADGRWESLVTSNSTGTSKTRNTHGFRLNQIFYMSANATYNENAVVGTYAVNEFFGNLLDHRYSFNTANDSTNGTTANTPIYLVGSINATDGLFYLDTKWWTQTLPTSDDGKLYIYIGDAYDYYRMICSSNHPIYWYKEGKLQEYSQSSNYAVSAGSASTATTATSATTASKLGSSNVGSATQPIYLSAGTATACTYTLGKSVPSDAVFTDTKNTAGSTDTSSKIYLVGATSQAANPQTYSDNEIYTTSGVLTTKSVQVGGGAATMEYDATTQSINFIFN